MNNQDSKFYPDVVIQALFVVPMLLCYFLAIFQVEFLIGALLIQLGVGAVQLLSGLFHVVVRKSQWHTTYFISALLYLLLLGIILFAAGNSGGDAMFFVCFGLFSGLIPVGIAIWYISKSLQYHKNYTPPLSTPSYGDDELLDDIFQVGS